MSWTLNLSSAPDRGEFESLPGSKFDILKE